MCNFHLCVLCMMNCVPASSKQLLISKNHQRFLVGLQRIFVAHWFQAWLQNANEFCNIVNFSCEAKPKKIPLKGVLLQNSVSQQDAFWPIGHISQWPIVFSKVIKRHRAALDFDTQEGRIRDFLDCFLLLSRSFNRVQAPFCFLPSKSFLSSQQYLEFLGSVQAIAFV